MEQYHVTGMSCAACQARVEKAVSKVPGVTSCAVSLLTNSMGVEGTADSTTIIRAVEDAGYGASLKAGTTASKEKGAQNADPYQAYEEELKDTETPKIIKRLIPSVLLLLILMYVSMGHMMWGFWVPKVLADNLFAIGLYELLITAMIMVINQRFFISGFRGLLHRSPNMDTLVALGATASFGYSVYALFAMSNAMIHGGMEAAMPYMNEFYFESAAMILTLITVGKLLEGKSKGRTTDALKSLMKLAPKTAVLYVDGKEVEVPITQVKVGDRFVVRPGESIPVDGVVVNGNSGVNEASLTGESIPVEKEKGSAVYAATINTSGFLECEATGVGEDTSLAQIIRMVSDAAATKAPIAKIADRVSGVFVPAVIGISVVTFLVWMLVGKDIGFSLARAISVLVISCPCSLGLATPVAIMVGNGLGAKNGILFKTAISLENAGKVQIVALDKTGTVTKGEPAVRQLYPAEGCEENMLLQCAYSLETKSEHPLAKAIVTHSLAKGIKELPLSDFLISSGHGLQGVIDGENYYGGNRDFVSAHAKIPKDLVTLSKELSQKGETPLYFAKEGQFLGVISVADVIREDSSEAIKQLKNLGIHVVMVTGDNEETAQTIGQQAGVDEVIAQVLPEEKEEIVRKLSTYGKVAMVGDGINDAPALTRADLGIAIGAGTDVAVDAADVVLMKNSLSDVAAAIRISRATLTKIHQNLFWAFFYNCLGIPLAAGLFIPVFGWTLSPMFGAAAMSLSSFCVVTNALFINLVKAYDDRHDKKVKNSLGSTALIPEEEYKKEKKEKENQKMEVSVKGMMCPHCEAHTKKAIEAIEGVVSATADHKTGKVVIETEKEVTMDSIKAAVEGAGYEFVG